MTDAPIAASEGSSHRQIIRSSAIVGSAAVLTNVIGLVRLKAVALLLGPVGVGLIGLYLNFVTVAATVGGLGLNASGVRDIASAEASGDRQLLSATIAALVACIALFGTATIAIVWLLRGPIAAWLQLESGGATIGWLSLAAGLTVFATLPLTLLNGFRKIGPLASVQVLGALFGTAAGLAILFAWREDGLIGYVIAGPAAAVLVGYFAWGKSRPFERSDTDRTLIASQAKHMVRLGVAFMLSSLALSLAVLLVRTTIRGSLGDVALGHFAATWIVSNTYVSFVLQAMGADFYPRLAATIEDRAQTSRLVSEQVETAMLLATPILLLTLAFAPLLLQLAYSSEFRPAALLLRFQILGDVFKIMAWPFAMSLLAARRSWAYWTIETSTAALYAIFVWMTVDRLGIESAGVGYLAMFLFYFAAQLAATVGGLRLAREAMIVSALCIVAVAGIFAASLRSELAAMIVGTLASIVFGIAAFRRMRSVGALAIMRP